MSICASFNTDSKAKLVSQGASLADIIIYFEDHGEVHANNANDLQEYLKEKNVFDRLNVKNTIATNVVNGKIEYLTTTLNFTTQVVNEMFTNTEHADTAFDEIFTITENPNQVSTSVFYDLAEDSEEEFVDSYVLKFKNIDRAIDILNSKSVQVLGVWNKNVSQSNQLQNIQGENITSKGSDFAKKLTNVGNTISLTYKGKEYVNSEHAYQTWKSGEFNQQGYNLKGGKVRGGKIGDTFSIMIDILTERFKQHPELVKGINERGGLEYLQKSTHNIIGDKFWESTGQNKFIEALTQAYKNFSQVVDSGIDNYSTYTSIPTTNTKLSQEEFNNQSIEVQLAIIEQAKKDCKTN